jgi:hypothetical protein
MKYTIQMVSDGVVVHTKFHRVGFRHSKVVAGGCTDSKGDLISLLLFIYFFFFKNK